MATEKMQAEIRRTALESVIAVVADPKEFDRAVIADNRISEVKGGKATPMSLTRFQEGLPWWWKPPEKTAVIDELDKLFVYRENEIGLKIDNRLFQVRAGSIEDLLSEPLRGASNSFAGTLTAKGIELTSMQKIAFAACIGAAQRELVGGNRFPGVEFPLLMKGVTDGISAAIDSLPPKVHIFKEGTCTFTEQFRDALKAQFDLEVSKAQMASPPQQANDLSSQVAQATQAVKTASRKKWGGRVLMVVGVGGVVTDILILSGVVAVSSFLAVLIPILAISAFVLGFFRAGDGKREEGVAQTVLDVNVPVVQASVSAGVGMTHGAGHRAEVKQQEVVNPAAGLSSDDNPYVELPRSDSPGPAP